MRARAENIVATLGFGLCIYVLAYAATVRRPDQLFCGWYRGPVYFSHEYHFFGCRLSFPAVDFIFAPAHWLDQRLRKDYWLAFEIPELCPNPTRPLRAGP
jgi:hypothetical protein